jgi:hypothetical protein
MKKIFTFLIIIVSANFCFSQIKGRCIDETGKPILYANVGIVDSNMGTVTNAEGEFVIDGELGAANTIVVSCMGYETKSIVANRNASVEVVMKLSSYELEEVKIGVSNYKYTKEKRIGNNVLTEHVVVGFHSKNKGAEIGKFFKVNKGKKYQVERMHFKIAELGYKKGTFRINFYKALDEENIEKQRCNEKDIIMEVSKLGDVDVDVTSENLVFEDDFLVAIECIEYVEKKSLNTNEHKAVYFSSNVFCGPFYLRENHLEKWKPKKEKYNMGLGMQLFVKY